MADQEGLGEPVTEADLAGGPSTSRNRRFEQQVRCEKCFMTLPASEFHGHMSTQHPDTSSKGSASGSSNVRKQQDSNTPKRSYKKRQKQVGMRKKKKAAPKVEFVDEAIASGSGCQSNKKLSKISSDGVVGETSQQDSDESSIIELVDPSEGNKSTAGASDVEPVDKAGTSGSESNKSGNLSNISTEAVVGEMSRQDSDESSNIELVDPSEEIKSNAGTSEVEPVDKAGASGSESNNRENLSNISTEAVVGEMSRQDSDESSIIELVDPSEGNKSTAGASDVEPVDKPGALGSECQSRENLSNISTEGVVGEMSRQNSDESSIIKLVDPSEEIKSNAGTSEVDKAGASGSESQNIGSCFERVSVGLYSSLDENEYLAAINDDENENADYRGTLEMLFDEPEFSRSTSPSQETQLSAPVCIETLAETLSNLVTDKTWVIDHTEKMCRLSLLSQFPNATVCKGVCWRDSKAEVFINNRHLPSDNFLWGKELSNPNDVTAVANYIWKLAFVLSGTDVCAGIPDFEEYWNSDHGFVESEIYLGEKCFRSKNCSLAISRSMRCKSCQALKETFRKRKWKIENQKGTDSSKITNISMSREQLEKKAASLQESKKVQEKLIKRLKDKIKNIIEKESIEIDQHLGSDFMKILKASAKNMTDVQKLFWKEQLKAISRQDCPSSMRWNPMMVRIALHLQSISPSALDYMRDAGFIKMPCKRMLFDFTHFVDNQEGVQQEILNLLEKKVKDLCIPDGQKYFNVAFDEITIKSDLVRNRHGELIGYVKLNEVESALKNLEDSMTSDVDILASKKPQLAKKVLAYMLIGFNNKIHEVVGLFSTTDVTAVQIYSRTWDVIYSLEAMGLKIICLICDGAGSNKKFFSMHKNWNESAEYVYATKNLYSGENRPIFFMVDPPHLLKTIRNCLSNSFAHLHSREMLKNKQVLSWKALEKLYEVDIDNPHKIHKLTKAHVQLTSFTRMRVSLASQALSESVATSLCKYSNDARFHGLITSELVTFIKNCNRLFDCLNGSDDPKGTRNKFNLDLLPYTSCEDERFHFLQSLLEYFQTWEKEAMALKDKTLEEKRRCQISRESFESLHITINGFCGAVQYLLNNTEINSVCAKDCNQDKLEQEFGLFRMGFGSNMHPTLQQLIQKVLTNYVQRSAALPVTRGNIGGKRKILEVDESPLPKRPRPNK